MDLYAGDSELHYSHSDLGIVEAKIYSGLDKVAWWMSSSQSCLNVVKSTAVLIGSQQRIYSIPKMKYAWLNTSP